MLLSSSTHFALERTTVSLLVDHLLLALLIAASLRSPLKLRIPVWHKDCVGAEGEGIEPARACAPPRLERGAVTPVGLTFQGQHNTPPVLAEWGAARRSAACGTCGGDDQGLHRLVGPVVVAADQPAGEQADRYDERDQSSQRDLAPQKDPIG